MINENEWKEWKGSHSETILPNMGKTKYLLILMNLGCTAFVLIMGNKKVV